MPKEMIEDFKRLAEVFGKEQGVKKILNIKLIELENKGIYRG